MTYVRVEPAVLHLVSGRLLDAVAVAQEVEHERDSLEARVEGEHDVVRGAVGSFLDRWGYGCECLVTDATETADRLDHASRCYVEVEGVVAGAFEA